MLIIISSPFSSKNVSTSSSESLVASYPERSPYLVPDQSNSIATLLADTLVGLTTFLMSIKLSILPKLEFIKRNLSSTAAARGIKSKIQLRVWKTL